MRLESKTFTSAVLKLAPLLITDPSGLKASARLRAIKVGRVMQDCLWKYAEELAYPGISVRPGIKCCREIKFRERLQKEGLWR